MVPQTIFIHLNVTLFGQDFFVSVHLLKRNIPSPAKTAVFYQHSGLVCDLLNAKQQSRVKDCLAVPGSVQL